MNDDIIRMAREAGFAGGGCEALFRFAALVRADEREACARVCEERKHYWQRDDIRRHEDEHCATAIRARGQQPPAAIADRLARHGIPMPEDKT